MINFKIIFNTIILDKHVWYNMTVCLVHYNMMYMYNRINSEACTDHISLPYKIS